MCTTTISTLNLTTMLQDPLIKLVMRSDNVSEQDYSAMLYRVQKSLLARNAEISRCQLEGRAGAQA
ncbi:MAG: hypothetical protein U1E70_28730 [Acetobacteraceae bacterium]